jgi:predicted enzyme related to lactoylglutathione lyase
MASSSVEFPSHHVGEILQIAYANVFVRELKQSVEFYQDVPGLKLQHADTGHGYASFECGPISLGLAVAEGDQSALVGRHTGIGFAVADLVAEHARLAAAGVEFTMPPERQPWGGFLALFQDPDGNVYYLDEVSATHS